MALSDSLPSDSVLRRHALSERNRILGLPPTDAVLRRHHEQWEAAQAAQLAGAAPLASSAAPRSATVKAAAPRAAAPVAAPAVQPAHPRIPPAPVPMPPARSAAPSGGGGLFGWLRRIFGR
jgi:hypothetical protein